MDVKLFFVILGCMTRLVSSVYFEDCGGHGFIIKSVQVEGCSESTCRIPVGNLRNITVNSLNEVTNFVGLHSIAQITYMGHRWQLAVTPHDICLDWGCPFSDSTTRTYSGGVFFNSTLLRRPAQLTLTANYETSGLEIVGFCVRIPVELV